MGHTKEDPNVIRKLFSLTIKIVLVIGKYCWYTIAREGANPLTGSIAYVTGRNTYFVSHEKYFL